MKFGFQENESFRVKGELPPDAMEKLPENIHYYTGWRYKSKKTAEGYRFTPTFVDAPYRNSFVAEITVRTSYANGETVVEFSGRPLRGVRIFNGIWFGLLAIFEALLLCALVVGQTEWYAPLIPLGMAAFGYLLCKIGLWLSFRSVMKPIRGALGQ